MPAKPSSSAHDTAAKTVKVAKTSGANAASVTRKTAVDPRPLLDPSERDRLIAETAYYRAESRGFAPGDEQADWFAAAQEVDAAYRFA